MEPRPTGMGPPVERSPESGSPSGRHWALQMFLSNGSDLCHWSPESTAQVFSENNHSLQPACPQASLFSPLEALTAGNCTRPEAGPGRVGVWSGSLGTAFFSLHPPLPPGFIGFLDCSVLGVERPATPPPVVERGEEGFISKAWEDAT